MQAASPVQRAHASCVSALRPLACLRNKAPCTALALAEPLKPLPRERAQVLLTKLRAFAPAAQLICISATMGGLDPVISWLDARLFLTNFRPVKLQEHLCLGAAVFACAGAPGAPRGADAPAALLCSACRELGVAAGGATGVAHTAAAATQEPGNAAKRHKPNGAAGTSTAVPAFMPAAAIDTGRKGGLRGTLDALGCPKDVCEGALCAQGMHLHRILPDAALPHSGSVAERVALGLTLEVMHVRSGHVCLSCAVRGGSLCCYCSRANPGVQDRWFGPPEG